LGFETPFQEFVYLRSYSRWLENEQRRETWPETVGRYSDFMVKRVPSDHHVDFLEACTAIEDSQVMPSMRALWAAGKALERENLAAYNCTYTVINSPKVFAEILYILMNGCGVGFSVERQYINRLPQVPDRLEESDEEIVFEDSKLGWAEGYYRFIRGLYAGKVYRCNLDKIRPRGARLKTFGGRASGPEPLRQLIDFTGKVFKQAEGRKLNSVECYDIACYVANIVVVGGVRRSATISLSNLSDRRMANAKTGEFWASHPQRQLSNNSVAYTEKPDCTTFLEEWLNLAKSKSGERGIFNREAAKLWASTVGRRDPEGDYGINPCGEILLLPEEGCNLTEAVVRPDDTLEILSAKVRMATILGMVQSTLTKFGFVGKGWSRNMERERLLGVSLTGLRDHPILGRMSRPHELERWLSYLKVQAVETAREWSEVLGVSMPAAVTCIKPSGTVSTLVGASSGLHPRHAPYYLRRVRVSNNDPIAQLLMQAGVPHYPEVGQTYDNMTTTVFEFPVKSPENSVFRDNVSAIDQLEYFLMVKKHWCEHNPSTTIYVKEDEWFEVGNWVYRHWDMICGVTFLPYDGGVYQLAPYEEITEEQYEKAVAAFPSINFEGLEWLESTDNTEGAREFACVSGACEI
jgi:ribonucleoside-triphosphate reductase